MFFSFGLMFALLFLLTVLASLLTGQPNVEAMLMFGVVSTFFLWNTKKEFKNGRTIGNAITYVGVLLFSVGIFPVITGYGTIGSGMGKTFAKVDRNHEFGFLILGLILLGIGFIARGFTKDRKVEPAALANGDKPRD